MNRHIHQEPIIVDIGFKPNRRGGWWYQEPNNHYTLQIIPAGKERRGWVLGIAHRGPMRWGRKTYPAPEAAALHACRVVKDDQLCELIADTMTHKHQERQERIQQELHDLMEGK